MAQFRQGDVFIEGVPSEDVPKELRMVAPDNGRVILAYGEVTGHAHALDAGDAELFTVGDIIEVPGSSTRYLRIGRQTALKHEEHGTIVLDPGWYRVRQQREYTPGAIRNVAD